ncbi:hypothetical protein [Evansella clarkii]|uniref:hypothetical protein n=1 Tax=Evansella clarkii TaxID=79879 RepID=UPI00099810DB|nr:hypothetical protein [Evansella clarkii]
MVTVTMPIHEYEKMKKVIARLKEESIFNYVEKEYSDFENDEYEVTLDAIAITHAITKKEGKPVLIKRREAKKESI